MSGSNALQITDPNDYSDNLLYSGTPSEGAALGSTVSTGVDRLSRWLAEQRAKSSQMGYWNNQTGLPTSAGLVNAAQQYANAVLMGTVSPGSRINLEQVNSRTLKPLSSEPDLTQPGSHTYSIKDASGNPIGLVDTEWSPDTGNLHVADFQSNEGANSLGVGAVRQIRDQLVARYPGVRTLSGQRITGAVSADTMSGAGPGRAASQVVTNQ